MREQIEKRPSVVLMLGLICGLAVFACPASVAILALIGVVVRPMPLRIALVAAFVLGTFVAPRTVPLIAEPTPIHQIGTVATVPKLYTDGERCVVSVGRRSILVTMSVSSAAVLGDEVRISGIERPISAAGEEMARLLGVEGSIRLDRVVVVRHGTWLAGVSDGWRRSFVDLTIRNLDEREAALLDAVCFNAGSLLPAGTKQELEQSGLIHIVSASGLQVFVFAFLLGALFQVAPLPRVVQFGLLSALLVAYAMASGLNPAIVRSVAMAIASLGAYWLGRDPDPLSAMALVGCGYLLWNPLSLFNPGFQLSYAVVTAVCLFYRRVPIERGRGCFGDLMKEYFRASAVILAAAIPLSAYYFGSISLVIVLANALVCVTLPLVVSIAFLAYAMSIASGELAGAILRHFAGPLIQAVEGVVTWLGSGIGNIDAPAFSGYWLLVFYVAWAMTYRRRVAQP